MKTILHVLPKRQLKRFKARTFKQLNPQYQIQTAYGQFPMFRRLRPVPDSVWYCHFERKVRRNRILRFTLFANIYRAYIQRYAAAVAADVRAEIGTKQFDSYWINNGNRLPMSAISHVANELRMPCIHVEKGLLPKTLCIDLKGVNARNSLPRAATFYLPYADQAAPYKGFERIPDVKTKRSYNGYDQALPEQFIFVPLQINYDTQMILHGGRLSTVEDFFRNILAAARQKPHMSFIVKEHPLSKDYLDRRFKKSLPTNVQFRNELQTYTLLRRSTAVIMVNSTMGVEALLLGKKIIVAGEACYDIEGLVLNGKSYSNLLQALDAVEQWQINNPLRRGFLHYLEHHYLVSKTPSESFDQRLEEAVMELLK